jgi:hypothetical protein
MLTDRQGAWVFAFTGIDPARPAAAPAPVAALAPAGSPPPGNPPPGNPSQGNAPANDPSVELDNLLSELDTEATRLKADGIPPEAVDGPIGKLHAARDAAVQAGGAKLTALVKKVKAARDEMKADYDRQVAASTTGGDSAIKDLFDAASTMIDKLDPKMQPGQDLVRDRDGLKARITAIDKEKDPAKQATARTAADTDAKALLKRASDASGNSAEAKKSVQAAYQKALEEKFGMKIGRSNNLTTDHTHFDKLYDVLEKMPVGHVAHANMKEVTYDKQLKMDGHGIGLYSNPKVVLGDIGDENVDSYKDPSDPAAKPSIPRFDITVLHELGHSVDTRWHIMTGGDRAKDSYGGWRAHGSLDDVAQEIANQFIAGAGRGVAEADVVKQAVVTKINSGRDDRPADMTDPNWTKLSALLAKCAKDRFWFEPFGTRGYGFGSDGNWYSYSWSARQQMRVSNYQWTAPGEWFAELYAVSWYLKKEPPAQVDAKVRAYMYRPGAAPPAAP